MLAQILSKAFIIGLLFSMNAYANHTMQVSTIENVNGAEQLISLVTQAYQQLGYNIKLNNFPAHRALVEANSKPWLDAELARSNAAQKYLNNLIKIPVILTQLKVAGYVLEPSVVINSLDDLNQYRIATIRGFISLNESLATNEILELNDIEQSLEVLLKQRVDMIILPKLLADYVVSQKKYIQIKMVELPIADVPIYHFINKRHQHLVAALTQSLHTLTGNPIEQ